MPEKFRKIKDIIKGFASSISFDKKLYKYDIEGSIAHTKMLEKCKIIKLSEAKEIIEGLKEIQQEIETGKFKFASSLEDIHMNIEKRLIQKIGKVGGKLHTARSRNDQITLDMKMYLRDEIKEIKGLIKNLQKVIVEIAEKNKQVIMPGYTHLQPAQPILFSHHLMSYFFMLERDKERFSECLERVNVMPLGVGALAGTSFPIDREYVAKLLDFTKVTENSLDTVSDRDYIIEFLSDSALLMMHLSRLSEELILWSSKEFSFVELAEVFCSGSSMMPQKRNPDLAELIRGKTGRVYGNLFSLLTVMKSLPLSYNKDMQEDKEPLFDTVGTVKNALIIYAEMLKNITVNKERMEKMLENSFLQATDIADYLVGKGIPFRQAHQLVSNLISYCINEQKGLKGLSLSEFQKFSEKFNEDIFSTLDLKTCVERRKSPGGTALERVEEEIEKAKQQIKDNFRR